MASFKYESGTQIGYTSSGAAVSNDFSSPPPSSTTTPRRLTRSASRLTLTGTTPVDIDSVGALATRVETASLQSPSPSPRKRNRASDSAGSPTKKMRAEAAVQKEDAELKPLTDRLQPNLDVVFCGINPGRVSSKVGAHYGNPNNHFWRALHASGFTSRLVAPLDEAILPPEFSLGLTDIVVRPTAGSADLSKSEFREGVPGLLGKIVLYRPRIVCFVGKEVWQRIEDAIRNWSCTGATDSTLIVEDPSCACPPIDCEPPVPQNAPVTSPTKRKKGKGRAKKPAKAPFQLGLQPYKLVHPAGDPHGAKETLFFVMISTSPIVSQYTIEQKVKMFAEARTKLEELKSGALDAELTRFRSLIFTTTNTDIVS